MLARNIAVSDEALPLWDIFNTASHKGSQVLLLAIPFVRSTDLDGQVVQYSFSPFPSLG